MKLILDGPSVQIDDGEGKTRRVAWAGFGSRRGASQRITYEEQNEALRLMAIGSEVLRIVQEEQAQQIAGSDENTESDLLAYDQILEAYHRAGLLP